MKAPLPRDEADRLQALRDLAILDTPPERELDAFVQMASLICDAPISLISLVDQNRQWFKARIGLTSSETSRDVAFCSHAILGRKLFVVKDAQADPKFSGNPLVTGDPNVRFYAGAPLITPRGHALGTLCVIDRVPKTLSEHQEALLSLLADQVVAYLELRKKTLDYVRISKRLDESQEQLSLALKGADLGTWDWHVPSGTVVYSERLLEMLGYRPGEAEPHVSWWESIVHPDDMQNVMAQLRSHLEGKTPFYVTEHRCRTRNGSWIWILDRGQVIERDEKGNPIRACGTHMDITERKELSRRLEDAAERLTLAARAGGVGVWDWDIEKDQLAWDPTMYQLYGLDPKDFRGAYDAWVSTLHPEDRAATEEAIQDALVGRKNYEPEFRILLPGGRVRHIKAFSVLHRDASGKPRRMVGTNWDITERTLQDLRMASIMKQLEAANRELHSLSIQDPLTGCSNRRAFTSALDQEWDRARRNASPLSLLMIDVDHFKNYNDTHGHQEGDACLRKVSGILRKIVRRAGDVVARYGGEEFAVLLPGTGVGGVNEVAEQIRQEVQSSDAGVTVSIGCATVVPGKDGGPDNLVKVADDALYQAKKAGRNRVLASSPAAV